jgi:hypothetical protein
VATVVPTQQQAVASCGGSTAGCEAPSRTWLVNTAKAGRLGVRALACLRGGTSIRAGLDHHGEPASLLAVHKVRSGSPYTTRSTRRSKACWRTGERGVALTSGRWGIGVPSPTALEPQLTGIGRADRLLTDQRARSIVQRSVVRGEQAEGI